MTTINFASFNNVNVAAQINPEKEKYDMVMSNIQKIGNKYFATVPVDMIIFDPAYQRNEVVRESKLKALAENWIDALCDPLKVAPHPEIFKLACYDGSHRYITQVSFGRRLVVCEIDMELGNMEPKARQIEEARRFAKQSDNVDRLSIVQKHDANVLIGNKANLLVQALCDQYNIAVKPGKARGRLKMSDTLTGLGKALQIAAREENHLADTFEVVCKSGWNHGADGFKGSTIEALEVLYNTHPDKVNEITATLIKWFRKVEPEYIKALGNTNYPMRKSEQVKIILVLEDYLHREIGLPYTYTERHGIKIAEI